MLRSLSALFGVVGATSIVHGDTTKPSIDLTSELRAIGAKRSTPDTTRSLPVAGPSCPTPTQAERAAVTKRVLAWIDAKHPDERGALAVNRDTAELLVNFGCTDSPGSFVLDLSQDREPAKPNPNAYGARRNYLLRVTSAIEVVAEDTSTLSMNWMEWADEGRIALLAQVDLDGDGALDIVYSDHEHEGGSSNTYDRIHVHYANGRRGESAQITNLVDVKLVKDQLVIAGQTRDDQVFYGCLGRDLHVGPCAASSSLQRAADRRSLIARYSSIDASELPDRDLLAQQLASLGITGKRKAALVAAAAETTATVRAQRHVTAFLVKVGLVEPAPMPDIVTQPHAEARTYLDDLSSKLGDAACVPTPLTDAERVKATAWVRKQDERASSIMIAASGCGPYIWVSWTPNPSDSKSREVLLGRDGTTRILGFTSERFTGESMSEDAFGHIEKWFSHDGAIVGIAIANQSLWVIADGKAIAQTKGASLAFYRYDDRWEESSNDVFLDGGTLWHATPTGREKLDLALVRDHEARRAAIALLAQSLPSADAKYLGALKLLGADAALIAECKKLP